MYTARPELGTKRICVHCAVRFYDLDRPQARCPACGADQPPPRVRTAPVPRAPGARWATRGSSRPAVDAEAAHDDAAPLLDAADTEEGEEEEADEALPDDTGEET